MQISIIETGYNSVHDVATILKEFFRDLPEPLLPREVYHPLLAVQSKYRRKIRLIESNVKCRYLKNWPVKGLCGRCFICLRPPPLL